MKNPRQVAFLNTLITSDKWILKTARGPHIEIEDIDSVTLSGLSWETLLSLIERTFF